MKRIRLNFLKNLYLSILFFLVISIVLTPYLITDGVSIFEEETAEMIIIAILFVVGAIISLLYSRELKKQEKTMEEVWKHVGETNLQIERYKKVLLGVEKYPESKKDFQNLLKLTAEKIMGITNCDSLKLRLINVESLKTLTEYSAHRSSKKNIEINYKNKDLIKNNSNGLQNCHIIKSETKNIIIKSFCVTHGNKITEDQDLFIQKIINDLVDYYVIFTSIYYKG